MKKFIVLLAALLAISSVSALAQAPVATKVYEVSSGEFLGNTNLVAFRNESFGLQGIKAPDGTEVVAPEYLNLNQKNIWGYIDAAKEDRLNGKGVIDAQGNVLVPFEYGEIEVLSDEWIVGITLKEATKEHFDYQALFGGYGSGYYLVDGYTFFNMKSGEAVGTLPREGYDQVYPYEGFVVVKDLQGAITVYDETFTNIGTADSISGGYVFMKNGDQYDVKRAGDGKMLFSTPYSVGGYDRQENNFKVSDQSKQGRVDLQGNVVIAPEYESLMSAAGGYYRARQLRDGKMGVLDLEGNVVVDFKYDEVPLYYARGTSVGSNALTFVDGYAPVELDGKLGYVNDKGEETVAPTYAKDAVELNANTMLISDATGKKTIVAADGVVTEMPYEKVERIFNSANGRLYLVTNATGQVGVVDWHGQEVIPVGAYAGYGTASSTDSSMLTMRNQNTGTIEVYALTQPE